MAEITIAKYEDVTELRDKPQIIKARAKAVSGKLTFTSIDSLGRTPNLGDEIFISFVEDSNLTDKSFVLNGTNCTIDSDLFPLSVSEDDVITLRCDGTSGKTWIISDESLYTKLNSKITTLNSEVVDARTGTNGQAYNSLGAAIRGQFNTMGENFESEISDLKGDLSNLDDNVEVIENKININHTFIGGTEYICSCFKKNESDTYDLSIKSDHTLNSSGKCTVCDKQVVGVAITRGKDLVISGKKYLKYVYTKELIDYTLVDYGLVYSNNGTYSDITSAKEALYCENADGTNVKLKSLQGKSTIVAVEDIGYTVYTVGYLRYTDKNGQTQTIYTDVSQGRFREANVTLERLADSTNEDGTKKYVNVKASKKVVEYEALETGILINSNGKFTSKEQADEGMTVDLADGTIIGKLTFTDEEYILKARYKDYQMYEKGYIIYKDENGVTQTKYTEVLEAQYGDGGAPIS